MENNQNQDILDKASDREEQAVANVKETVTAPLPSPPPMQAESTASDLKQRLDWGEPGLTIIDVRDRAAYNKERITGAIPVPMSDLVSEVKSTLESNRDIYLYGESDEASGQAASMLSDAGFESVARIKGGLSAWKAISGPTEGQTANG
ncbi:MAG: rhodanese-like domain-containing protein [Leptolyngbyaceae cyanobacterium SM1_1_3]|nr:rhodanese-like domain-containing protein [Leptolyngbyaceae cyanobacterium SM1_1_3]NJM84743.1 rhodanese-like domain-containing protein [Leptolyngbyaceae cyanobacterium RM2_2_21]NJN01991.1 rhodanese-like domain-containing protein [Leptolyngbyaceae cyanobacterium RM1_1_2]NJO10114.1 rhodanese-like domain-containing protein [Leptolyngbyaceae cyanobacterium SL_1_1]